MKRGEVWVANLNPNRGQEIGKVRPVLVIQDDRVIAAGIPTVLVLPLTTQVWQDYEPFRVTIKAREKLESDSQVVVEQVRTLDRNRFGEGPLTTLTSEELAEVELSLKEVLGLR